MSMTRAESKKVLLKEADIFSSLPPHEIELLAQNSEFVEYAAGEAVFGEGDSGNALYIVDSGEVVITRQDESGQKTDIARYVKGDSFGELDLFTDSVRAAWAYTSAPARLLVFPGPGTGFTAFLEEHPELSARILHKILAEIAGRIRRVNHLVTDNSPVIRALKKQVYTDKLTGLYNHTFITEKIGNLIEKKDSVFSVLMVKPDNFKELNDTWGHEAGDKAIRILSRELRDFIGGEENTARYKGNAMAVLLPEGTKQRAFELAARIRDFLGRLDLSGATGGEVFSFTASIGIVPVSDGKMTVSDGKMQGSEQETNAADLLFMAHELSLEGRSRGGNQILFPQDPEKGARE